MPALSGILSYPFDAYFDNKCNKLKSYMAKFKKKYPELASNAYPEQLAIIFERYIEIHGHAYCMDLKKERKKTAKILYNLLCELKT